MPIFNMPSTSRTISKNSNWPEWSIFEGRRCYWLHGTTHWGKDNNQFYDVETGLPAGYRFQSESA
jgi:hypothetical protein